MLHLEQLMPHQAAGVPWLIDNPRGMLAWEMGVGKTATLLRAWENSPEHGPALVLCLASARENWRREALRFTIDRDLPPRVQVLATSQEPVDPSADIVITNYDKLLIPTVIRRLRGRGRWGALILDEARKLKNPNAQCTKLVYGGGHGKQTPLIDLAARVWPADGTPMPNHPGELWTHAYHLWPETLIYRDNKPMELWEFELGFCVAETTKYGTRVIGGKNLDELRQRLGGKMNVLKRKDCLDLPPLRVASWPLDGETTSGTGRCQDMPELLSTLSERYGRLDDIELFDHATLEAYLACITQNFSAVATVRREVSILKAIASGLLLKEELEQGAPKTVVFAHHREAISTLEKILKPWHPAVIHGGTKDRDEQIDKFQNDPACMVFIGQMTAAGSSINLQAGENVLVVEASWTPGDNEQALARVYRAGQTKPVFVRFAYLPGSIDEAVSRSLARKTAMISQVVK